MSDVLTFGRADSAIERVAQLLREEAMTGPRDAVRAFADALGATGMRALADALQNRRALREDIDADRESWPVAPVVTFRETLDGLAWAGTADLWPPDVPAGAVRVLVQASTPRADLLAQLGAIAEAIERAGDDLWRQAARAASEAADADGLGAAADDVPF